MSGKLWGKKKGEGRSKGKVKKVAGRRARYVCWGNVVWQKNQWGMAQQQFAAAVRKARRVGNNKVAALLY